MDSLESRLSPLRGERVLVTGMSGFKGVWLSVWLKALGCEVVGLSLEPETSPSLFREVNESKTFVHHVVDIRDRESLQMAFSEIAPSVVFHLAAQPLVLRSYSDPTETFDTNVTGSLNILEAIRQNSGVRCLVYITSDKCYLNDESGRLYVEGDQLGGRDPYSASKAAAEILFSSYWESFLSTRDNFGAVSVRSGNVIGGGDWSVDRLIPDCVRALASGAPILIRKPDAVRPWQHVLDPLKGYLMLASDILLKRNPPTGAWNFGPDNDAFRTVEDVARAVLRHWGDGTLQVTENGHDTHEAGLLRLDSAKARNLLGWSPMYSFDEAILSTLSWYRAYLRGESPRYLCEREITTYMEESG